MEDDGIPYSGQYPAAINAFISGVGHSKYGISKPSMRGVVIDFWGFSGALNSTTMA